MKYGIINFHPGKIPEASGLDSLLWSIHKNLKPYVTTHFIDNKIDAGQKIYEREVELSSNDRLEDIKYRINLIVREELEKLCKNYLLKNKKIPSKKIKNYTSNNKPMTEDLQKIVLSKFEKWKKKFT